MSTKKRKRAFTFLYLLALCLLPFAWKPGIFVSLFGLADLLLKESKKTK